MERQEIYQLLDAAKKALNPTQLYAKSFDEKVTKDARDQYRNEVKRIFGFNSEKNLLLPPRLSQPVIAKVREAKVISTLRKRARAVRYEASLLLQASLKTAEHAQRNKDWVKVEKIVSSPYFQSLTKLAGMMPAEYRDGWKAERRRKGKKSSLHKLADNWRELMVAKSTGQYRLPMMVAIMTGCRPAELEKGVFLKIANNSLYVQILGAKVKENAGQEFREFRLANHSITTELMQIMESEGLNELLVKVEKGNSITTHMRNIASKVWPKREQSITVYTARHAMAADCKAAVDQGADEDLVSRVLGHVVDKTASYYGTKSQSGSSSVVPSSVVVPKPVRHKMRQRSKDRAAVGKIPSRINTAITNFKP